jgi:hypothetical protein
MKLNLVELGAGALCLAISLGTLEALPPDAAVSGVAGVNQKAVPKIKPVDLASPPPPNSSSAQRVNKVDGIDTIDGVKAAGQTVPVPPPPTAGGNAINAGSVGSAGSIRAIHGVGGIDTVKIQNLETALMMKQETGTPAGNGEEHGGKGKAAAAALLAAPLGKVPAKKALKEDGRAGFQEFEKLQNRGS